jgi:pimeloyl-ACP methyl ester carboxylesterase
MRTFVNIVMSVSIALAANNLSFAAKNYLPDRDNPVPADQPIPTVDFVRPPLFERPELSPDGKYFAALTKNEELKSNLVVCDIATGKVMLTHGDVSFFTWIGNEHLSLSWTENRVIKVSDPEHLLYVETVVPKYKYGLMADSGFLRASDRRTEPKFGRSQIDRKWHSPQDGELSYCQITREDGQRRLYRYEARKWVECPVNLEEITLIEIGQQPKEMLVLGPSGKDATRAIQRLNVVTGELGEVIYRDPKRDCLPSIMFKRGTREIIGVRVAKMTNPDVWFGETERTIQKLIDQQFKGSLARIVSMDVQGAKFLIKVESDRQPPVYNFLDWEKKSLALVKNTSPWIDPARMSPSQIMTYKTRDGLTIEGLVLLPPNTSKEHPAPLVVTLHGGPWHVRDAWGWAPAAQFLASHGYAVFSPNYRGTEGYDSRFAPEDRFDFQKMNNDVADGIDALAKTGLVDAKRVAAYGLGFGSYLALCGALENADLYRCAVIHGGVFDWEKAFRKADSSNWFELRWLQRRLQEYNQLPPSPLDRYKEIRFPIFSTRNVSVTDVTIESQASFMFNKLKDNARSVSFGDLNLFTWDEAYSEAGDRMDQIRRFLDENLKTK